jgi:hypothetical protein
MTTNCTRYEIELVRRGRATAVCACGWRSSTSLTPGVAAARWDDHARLQQRVDANRP